MEKNFLSSSSSQAYLGVHIRITHKQSINAYIQKLDDVSATKELIQMIIKGPNFHCTPSIKMGNGIDPIECKS